MNDQHVKADIVEDIKSRGNEFRAEVPPYAWSRIESRLDNNTTIKEISFYKVFYNAAMVIILLGMVTLLSVYIIRTNSNGKTIGYDLQIEELTVSNNSYPVYDIHQLHKAYLRLQDNQSNNSIGELGINDL